jgi:hypothetical protein
MIGVTALADAARYQLDTASLLTHVAAGAKDDFTSTAGRTFVAPTDASMAAAVHLLKPDVKSGTWPIPYAALRGKADAYPGTMVVYAAVATKGLSKSDASDYSRLIKFLATAGQRPGSGNGQLPAGYLPMTKSNGLEKLAAYTQLASSAVGAQMGAVPSVKIAKSTPSTGGGSGSGGTTGGSSGSTGSGTGAGGGTGTTPTTTPTATPTPSPTGSQNTTMVSLGTTQSLTSKLAGAILPIFLLLVVLCGVLAPGGGYLVRRWRRR